MTASAKSSLSTISVCPFPAAIPRGTECGGICGHEEKVTVNVEFMNNNKILSCNFFSTYISSSIIHDCTSYVGTNTILIREDQQSCL